VSCSNRQEHLSSPTTGKSEKGSANPRPTGNEDAADLEPPPNPQVVGPPLELPTCHLPITHQTTQLAGPVDEGVNPLVSPQAARGRDPGSSPVRRVTQRSYTDIVQRYHYRQGDFESGRQVCWGGGEFDAGARGRWIRGPRRSTSGERGSGMRSCARGLPFPSLWR